MVMEVEGEGVKSREARSQQLNNHYKREGGVRGGGGRDSKREHESVHRPVTFCLRLLFWMQTPNLHKPASRH